MFKTTRKIPVIAIAGLCVASPALAQAPAQYVEHDFLTDYSSLEPFADGAADYRYIAPNAFKDLANYDALMVDQPEIFISPDSKYKGAKPDNLKAIADLMRSSLATRLEAGGYNIVQTTAPGVLYLRIALADLELIKKKDEFMPSIFHLQSGLIHINRLKNGVPSIHPIRGTEIRALRRVKREYPDTGMVFVNHPTWTTADLPFGGIKNSGYGRELSSMGIQEFVNKKLVRVTSIDAAA